MLLVARLSGMEVKEARIAVDANADAGLILSEGSSVKNLKQIMETLGDVPLGVFVKGLSEEKIAELTSLGCDFVVFDIKARATILQSEKVGRFLMIEPSLEQGFVRAINGLEVDGVFISSRADDPFVAVEHLLICRRLVELLEKPAIMVLPSLVVKAELTSLWQAGIDGIVAPSAQSAEALIHLRKMINELPKRRKSRHTKASAILPQYRLPASEEDEGED